MTNQIQFYSGRRAVRSVNVAGWYWDVTNRAAPLSSYSSANAAYVDPSSDGGYASFKGAGNVPSIIATDGELADVLAQAGIEGPPVLHTQPGDWGGVGVLGIILAVQAAGCVITSTGNAALNGHYQLIGEPMQTMDRTQIGINAKGELPGNVALPWGAYSGTVTFNTPADFTAVYLGLQEYFQLWKTWAYHGGTMPVWGAQSIA